MKLTSLIILLIQSCDLVFSHPPETIPSELYEAFTERGKVSVEYYYLDQSANSGVSYYDKDDIDKLILKAKRKETFYYGKTDEWLFQLLDAYPYLILGNTVAIMGSGYPWYEAIILAYGGKPYSIDYKPI